MHSAPRAWLLASLRLLLIALVAASALAACSVGGDDDGDDAEPAATSEAAAPTPSASAAETPAATEPAADTTPAPDASPEATPGGGIGDPPATTEQTRVEEILADPAAFEGTPVVLDADVVEVVASEAMTVRDDASGGSLLVVGAPGVIPADLTAGDFARVSGEVRSFAIDDIEFEIGATLDDEAFADFAGEPVVIASDVRVGLVAVDDLLATPDRYLDRRITLTGPVSEARSEQALVFAALAGDERVLVVAPFRAVPAGEAQERWFRATGTPRILDDGNRDDFGDDLAFLFEDDAFADFQGQPVLVAEVIERLSDPTNTTVAEALAGGASEPSGVILSGTVASQLAQQALTLTDADGNTLLVVAQEGALATGLTDGATVLARGTLTPFSADGSEALIWRALGIDPAAEAYAPFVGQPALIAERVDLVAVAGAGAGAAEE